MPRTNPKTSSWNRVARRKAAPTGGYGAGWGGGPWFSDIFRSRRSPSPMELVESYRSLVYACVQINSNAVARIPLRLYATTKKGQPRPKCAVKSLSFSEKRHLKGLYSKAMANSEEVEEVTDHPLLDAVMRPNDHVSHFQLIRYTVMSLDIVGDAYWWPSMGRGSVEELWPLPPHLVWPEFTSGTLLPDVYRFGANAYKPDELLVFKHESMSNLYGRGYSPTQAAIAYVRLEDTFTTIQNEMLSNGPRPSVVISHKDPKGAFGEGERKRLEADMNSKGRGGKAGAAFVVDGAVSITPISYSPTDLGTKELSLYDLERSANCYGIPVSMLKTEDVNKANAEAGLEQHGRNAVEPRCKIIASALTRWTHGLDSRGSRGWDRLLWAFDPVVKEDAEAESKLHTTYVAMGLPLNVALTEAGYDAVEGGDNSLVPSTLVTLESLVNPPEPQPVPGGLAQGNGQAAAPDPNEETAPNEPEPMEDGSADAEPDPETQKLLTRAASVVFATERSTGLSWAELTEGNLDLDPQTKSMVALTAQVISDIGDQTGWQWDEELKAFTPCRDASGRFSSCGGGGGAGKKPPKAPKPGKPGDPKKPAAKPAAKPSKAPPRPAGKPAAPAGSPKPAATPKPAKPAKSRDTTATNFGPSKAAVSKRPDYTPAEHKVQLGRAKSILGPKATDSDIASIVGAPDHAHVSLSDTDSKHSISVFVRGQGVTALRTIKREPGGELTIRNESIHVEDTGKGVGARIFGRQVEQAVRLGATKITTSAGRGPGMNGYITWPKLGYDAAIPASVAAKLPGDLAGAKRLSDLMKTEKGTAFWTQHGVTTDMTFDLKAGSKARTHLEKYLTKKGLTK